jgi:tetratricopeptide (TPR) repeat protein
MPSLGKRVFLILMLLAGASYLSPAVQGEGQPADQTKPRLVMVKVPHWKVRFFNLPDELPVLIQPGETFDPARRQYDFEEGLEAMDVFLNLRPQDELAPSFHLFLQKWPLYQKFFKAVDAEDFDQARPLLAQIRKLDTEEPAVHFYAGSLAGQSGEYALAENEYRRCQELFPAYGPVYINLARLAMARQAQAEAKKYLQQAFELAADPQQAPTRRLAEQMLQSLEKQK